MENEKVFLRVGEKGRVLKTRRTELTGDTVRHYGRITQESIRGKCVGRKRPARVHATSRVIKVLWSADRFTNRKEKWSSVTNGRRSLATSSSREAG